MSRNGKAIPDPATLMAQIDGDARALDTAGKHLSESIRDLADAERAYEEAMCKALIEIHDSYKESGERPPAEDMRRALAHRQIDRKVYGEYLEARAKVDAGRAWCRARESSLSARQSLLRALSEEARAA